MRTAWRCLLALFLVWSLTAGVILILDRTRPTPQKFISYVAQHPFDGLTPAQRAKIIERAAGMINGFNTEQRRELKQSGALRKFFVKLTTEERRRFAELTLPAGFRSMVRTLNKMDPAERVKLAEKTLRDLRHRNAIADDLDESGDLATMLSRGSAIFEKEAEPQVKLDFAPVFAEVQEKQRKLAPEAKPRQQ